MQAGSAARARIKRVLSAGKPASFGGERDGLVALLLLLLLLGIVGGVVFTKFLFLVLIVAALIAVFGLLSRRTA